MTPPNRPIPVHAPMRQFAVTDGQLLVGGIPLQRLAARVGQTPFYAYDRTLIKARAAKLRAALPHSIKLHYAIKANPMPAVVDLISNLVDGIDVASAGELKIALDSGVNPHEITFAGPGKRSTELRQAVAAGVLVNLESFREVSVLEDISRDLGIPARVAIRINPDFELKGSGMKMGGGPKQFGVDAEQVPLLLAAIAKSGLVFEGFHLFSGSQNLNAQWIGEAQQHAYDLALRLAKLAPSPIRVINLGGGFGIPYFPGEQHLDLEIVGENLEKIANQAAFDLPDVELVIELGRYIVGECGIFVTRVIDRKISRGQTFLVVDGGLNHHLSASGNFGQVIRKNYPVTIGNRIDDEATEIVSIVGPLCTPLDLLADKVALPVAEPGDLVVIFQSGAYGATASPQKFLGHPEAIEIVV